MTHNPFIGVFGKRTVLLLVILLAPAFVHPVTAAAVDTPRYTDTQTGKDLLQAAWRIARTVEPAKSRIETLFKVASVHAQLRQQTEILPILDELLATVLDTRNVSRKMQNINLYKITKLYAQTGHFARALEAAGHINQTSRLALYWRALSLAYIARQYAEAGMQPEALQTVSQALETTQKIRSRRPEHLMAMAQIGRVYASAGDRQAANELLDKVYLLANRSTQKSYTLFGIAYMYALIGELHKAQRTILTPGVRTHHRAMLLPFLVSEYIRKDQPEKAPGVIRAFDLDPRQPNHALAEVSAWVKIARWYIDHNEPKTAGRLLSTASRQARKMAKKNNPKYISAMILIGREYALMQKEKEVAYHLSRVLARVQKIKLPDRAKLVRQIALAYVEEGKTLKALELVKDLDKDYAKLEKVLGETRQAILGSKLNYILREVEVSRIIRQVETSHYKIKVLGAIAESYARNNETGRVVATLSKALESIKPQQEARLKAIKLTEIAREYMRAGVEAARPDLEYLNEIADLAQTAR